MRRDPPSRSAGFTLVELMVAVTIGLLLTVAVAQLFVGSRKSYATTDDVSRMQENIRFAHDVLSRTIRMAGYKGYAGNMTVTVGTDVGIFAPPNLALDGLDGDGGALSAISKPDTLTVRYQGTGDIAGNPDGATLDCLGNPVGPATIVTNTFTIIKDAATDASSLACNDQPIVADVDNIQVLYGEETSLSGDSSVDRYVPRHLVSNIDRVMSVRIALLFRTPNTGVRSSPDTTTYQLHGGQMPAFTGKDATRIRRVTTTTIALRNRAP
jgi:type IV pilus assembly protein PilW